ncbi:MAG: O-antigen ligase family protein [Candidatus Desantisbacteria bacterium]
MWTKKIFGQEGIFLEGANVKIAMLSLVGVILGMCVIFTEGWRMPIFFAILFAGVAAIFWKPFIGVVFFMLLFYFSPDNHGVGGARVSLYISMLVLVAWLIKGIGEKKLNIKWPGQIVVLGILSLWMFIITSIAHVSVSESLSGSITFFKIFVFCFLIIALVNSQRKIEIALAANIFGITYFSLNGFYSFLTGGDVKGIYSDNNSIAHILVLFFPFAIAMFFYPNKWIRLWGWGLLLMQLSTILISQSRGGLLGLAGVLIWMLFRGLIGFRWKMVGIIAMIFLLSAGILFGTEAGEKCIKRLDTMKNYQQDKGSAMKRIVLWQAGILMIKDHPITGVGLKNYILTFPEYNPYLRPQTPHNTYILFGSESGIPGLGLYLLLLIFYFKTIFDIRKKIDKNSFVAYNCLALEGGMVGHMISSLFITKAYFEPVYWLIMFVAILKELTKQGKISAE